MKKLISALTLVLFLAACNNDAGDTQDPIDSLEERKDTLIDNVDSTIDAQVDSLKERGEALKDKFDSTIEARKDSLKD